MSTTYFSLGSNLGNRLENLTTAIKLINQSIGLVTKKSKIYETQSWGYTDNNYLNMAVAVQTTLQPYNLLEKINEIESSMGRIRSGNGYEARPIDIDILFYDNITINNSLLTIPHPRINLRRFVLQPLSEIAPDFIHPTIGKTITELLNKCEDDGIVEVFTNLINC